MSTPQSLQASRDTSLANTLGIADLSRLPRTGAKGAGTADWLRNMGLVLPAQPNSWHPLPEGGLLARLGQTEYLIEGNAATVEKISQTARASKVYPVLHQDAAFALCGTRVNELLLQTCNVDFRTLLADPSKLVLTSMAGVSITLLITPIGTQLVYRIWCDGTYGHYLMQTLLSIAQELGGGLISADALP